MRFFAFFIIFILLFGCASQQSETSNSRLETENRKQVDEVKDMKITSSAFKHGENIPKKYTCDGENMNPPLTISDPPDGTESFALIVDDPDAPGGTWVHWIVWDIPEDTREIPERVEFASQGMTDFGSVGYGGPCPPSGFHTYRFKLYALDFKYGRLFEVPPTTEAIEDMMKGHILAQAELDGEYKRG